MKPFFNIIYFMMMLIALASALTLVKARNKPGEESKILFTILFLLPKNL